MCRNGAKKALRLQTGMDDISLYTRRVIQDRQDLRNEARILRRKDERAEEDQMKRIVDVALEDAKWFDRVDHFYYCSQHKKKLDEERKAGIPAPEHSSDIEYKTHRSGTP